MSCTRCGGSGVIPYCDPATGEPYVCECKRESVLTVWVIFKSPSDFPGLYVLRGQDVVPGQSEPAMHVECITCDTLAPLQAWCEERGLYRMDRQAGDDPTIVEVWL